MKRQEMSDCLTEQDEMQEPAANGDMLLGTDESTTVMDLTIED